MTRDQLRDFEQRFDQLSQQDQLLLIERLVRRVRRGGAAGEEEFARSMQEMAQDSDFLREMGVTP